LIIDLLVGVVDSNHLETIHPFTQFSRILVNAPIHQFAGHPVVGYHVHRLVFND
tara:strand:- start:530 stop:691 length:162 start_codon:yes stop_codon:yes gene_type:complete